VSSATIAATFFIALMGAISGPLPAISGATADQFADKAPLIRVQDRLELRSYNPYAGLQFEEPLYGPPQRGVESTRPEVIMPSRKSPIFHQGTPDPYTAQWYAYCSGKYVSFEPRTGLYTSFSGRKRLCR
jgi:BA14K-like protein